MIAIPTDEIESAPTDLVNSDPRFVDLHLPSLFNWYTFKSLAIRPLTAFEVIKIGLANRTDSFETLVQAISQTINRSVYQLTIGDFWTVLYWLRLNSYDKSPLEFSWSCADEQHNERVISGEVDALTLKNNQRVEKTTIKQIDLDLDNFNAVSSTLSTIERLNIKLSPATVGDIVGSKRLLDDGTWKDVDDFFNKYVSVLDRSHAGLNRKQDDYAESLQDRFKVASELPPDCLVEIEQFLLASTHGVDESVNVKCKECGAARSIQVDLNASCFSPEL